MRFIADHDARMRGKTFGARMAGFLKERWSNPETPNPNTGRKNSPASIEAMRAAHLGKTLSAEHRAKIGIGSTGRRHTPETRANMSAAKRAWWATRSLDEKAAILLPANEVAKSGNPTSIEIAVQVVLIRLGIKHEYQHRVGRFWLDFFLSDFNIDLECDGVYYHSSPARQEHDQKRDSYITAQGLTVVRLTEKAIRANAERAVRDGLAGVPPI